jgi:hypothetical protein
MDYNILEDRYTLNTTTKIKYILFKVLKLESGLWSCHYKFVPRLKATLAI